MKRGKGRQPQERERKAVVKRGKGRQPQREGRQAVVKRGKGEKTVYGTCIMQFKTCVAIIHVSLYSATWGKIALVCKAHKALNNNNNIYSHIHQSRLAIISQV